MKLVACVACMALCVLLYLPGSSLACGGGFWGEYPRAIRLTPVPGEPGAVARSLTTGGRAWLIPSPAGFSDLESFTRETLPREEHLEALAFTLHPGVACFVRLAGEKPSSGADAGLIERAEAPATAAFTVYTLDERPLRGVLFESLLKGTPLPESMNQTGLTPEESQVMDAFVAGTRGDLTDDVHQAVGDRATLDISLLMRVTAPGTIAAISVGPDYNHGASRGDMVAVEYWFRADASVLHLRYEVFLSRADSQTKEALAACLRRAQLEARDWVSRVCRLNDLPVQGLL